MSDERTGKALMKAVAEAVGWEWRNDPWGGEVYTGEERTSWTQFLPDREWNHAIKACEAAGCLNVEISWRQRRILVIGPLKSVGNSDGCFPESLCRALLAAIEARK